MKNAPPPFFAWMACFLILVIMLIGHLSCTPRSSVRQNQINRDRQKKEKEQIKTYRLELKQHLKNQSKSTRKMMKKSRKDSKRVSPHRK